MSTTATLPPLVPRLAEKEISYEAAPGFFASLRAQGLRIVQCHGTFDLVHPGHIVHFEEARALGDMLVVTITQGRFVNKGPGRPFFDDVMRVKALTALSLVDYVVVVPHPGAVEAIECVAPHVYCKGKEYANPSNDVTGRIGEDLQAVARLGGQVRYVGSVVFSSSQMINRAFAAVPKAANDRCRELAQKYTPEDFRAAIDGFSKLRVLAVGDIIFDRYSYVHVQGLTSKNRTMSARYLREETHPGGILAIARHLAAFTGTVDVMSLAGAEPWVDGLLKECLGGRTGHILRRPDFTTVVKQRFVESGKRSSEISKLFALNILDAEHPGAETEEAICRSLGAIMKNYDLVVLADFGHGLMLDRVRDLVQDRAPLLALNCQTNSYNHGFNLINRQYRRADFVSLDEQEIMLGCGQRRPDYQRELTGLATRFGCRQAWLTRGASESIGFNAADAAYAHMSPLETQVVDTVGAGDAFYAGVALAGACNLPIDLATFIGQLAGAQAVKIPGNLEPIRKDVLLRGGMNLLNQ